MYNSLDQPFLSPHCAPYSGFAVRFHRFSHIIRLECLEIKIRIYIFLDDAYP